MKKKLFNLVGVDLGMKLYAVIVNGNRVFDYGELDKKKLHDWKSEYGIDYVYVEAVPYVQNQKTTGILNKQHGRVMAWCEDFRLDCREVSVKQWKKLLTGNGNSSKEVVRNLVMLEFHGIDEEARQDVFDAVGVAYAGSVLERIKREVIDE